MNEKVESLILEQLIAIRAEMAGMIADMREFRRETRSLNRFLAAHLSLAKPLKS